ncbi:MAG: hypothetical protein PHW18_10165 [Sulfuricurvum sp.]|uniref:hypothetical protein n=1 Tax=Sulfuricurvum sp. TaxID=2025608 RepID=UPI002607CA29|nr:hypothetical protein [Sulfuricurvum sp.]MDD2829926.1 hypothetical protein [Sulfuricurvum sp.]MDD4949584.1 hypothetical protein [Sulfuricurvum sp.]
MSHTICEIEACQLVKFENECKCILHCDKSIVNGWILSETKPFEKNKVKSNADEVMLWNEEKINLFWETLFKEIKKKFFMCIRKRGGGTNAEAVRVMGNSKKTGFYLNFLKIQFPPHRKSLEIFIKENNKIIINNSFQLCTFYDNCIVNFSDLDIINNQLQIFLKDQSQNRPISFRHCDFKYNLILFRPNSIDEKISIDECTINQSIELCSNFKRIMIGNSKAENLIIKSYDEKEKEIDFLSINDLLITEIKISKITIKDSIIDKIVSNNIILEHSIFDKFVLKNIQTDNLLLLNIDMVDGSKILFETILTKLLKIEQLSQKAKYIQFHNIDILEKFECERVDFKNAYFYDFNISKSIKKITKTSFLDSNLSSVQWGDIFEIESTKDMFRQLKFVNDKQGNYIEANSFYSKEMESHKKEIFKKSNWYSPLWQEKIIFLLSENISNFGQSWFLALSWLILINLFFYTIVYLNASLTLIFFTTMIFSYYIGTLLVKAIKFTTIKHISTMIGVLIFISYLNIGSIHSFTEFISIKMPNECSIVYKKYLHFWFLNKVLSSFILYYLVIALRRQTMR